MEKEKGRGATLTLHGGWWGQEETATRTLGYCERHPRLSPDRWLGLLLHLPLAGLDERVHPGRPLGKPPQAQDQTVGLVQAGFHPWIWSPRGPTRGWGRGEGNKGVNM